MANKVRRPRLTLARPPTVRLAFVRCSAHLPADCIGANGSAPTPIGPKHLCTCRVRLASHAHLSAYRTLRNFLGRQACGMNGGHVRPPRHTQCSPPNRSACLRPVLCPFAGRLHRGKWTSTYTHQAEPSLHLSFGAVKRVPQGWLSPAKRTQAPLLLHTLSSPQPTWLPSTQVEAIRLQRIAPAEGEKPPHAHSSASAHRAHQQGGRPCACRVDDGQVRRTRHAHRSSFSGVSVYARKVLSLMRIASA